MPVYDDPSIPNINFYPNPEEFIRKVHELLNIRSILDVGAGHGGVFDYAYWNEREPMDAREACDIYWIRPMSSKWALRCGVDARELTAHYGVKSFDMVQCIETLEHIENNEKAIEELCRVARKFVFITSCDEGQHRGPEQEAIEKFNVHQKYLKQPSIDFLKNMGFAVGVEHFDRRQIIAWKIINENSP